MLNLIAAIVLQGQVSNDSTEGVIGIRWSWMTDKVYRVYKDSPADQAGIQIGDKIIKVKDDEGHLEIRGDSFSYVNITIKRDGKVLQFRVMRAPENQINREYIK